MNDLLVNIEDLNAGYNGKIVLRDVSLRIYKQDFLGIIGPNGGGKTTLIKVILGLLKPISGTISFMEKDLKDKIGYMPQTNYIDKKFPILVSEVVESGLVSKKIDQSEKKQKIEDIIQTMGLKEIADKPIGELSGGQLQRTLLARAIINEPELLILDEPNTYIDNRFESKFYELLKEINKKTAIVLISHNTETVMANAKNIACVNETLHYHANGL